MSASLVGSEMCIRDRHRLSVAMLSQLKGSRPLSCLSQISGFESRASASVSYTHLTAADDM
eukprot:5217590-Alexandrium_andersonii.AAC.1